MDPRRYQRGSNVSTMAGQGTGRNLRISKGTQGTDRGRKASAGTFSRNEPKPSPARDLNPGEVGAGSNAGPHCIWPDRRGPSRRSGAPYRANGLSADRLTYFSSSGRRDDDWRGATTISDFSELAMKQRSCASWCSRVERRGVGRRPGEGDVRAQDDPGQRRSCRRRSGPSPLRPRRHRTATSSPAAWASDEEPEHVAGGDRGDQRLLGIDAGRIRHRRRHDFGRGGADDRRAAVEAPFVAAAVAAAGEFAVRAPVDRRATCRLTALSPPRCGVGWPEKRRRSRLARRARR